MKLSRFGLLSTLVYCSCLSATTSYVTDNRSTAGENSRVYALDVSTNTLSSALPNNSGVALKQPFNVAVSSQGRYAYVTDPGASGGSGALFPINTTSNTITSIAQTPNIFIWEG